jgi:hypothetical protein
MILGFTPANRDGGYQISDYNIRVICIRPTPYAPGFQTPGRVTTRSQARNADKSDCSSVERVQKRGDSRRADFPSPPPKAPCRRLIGSSRPAWSGFLHGRAEVVAVGNFESLAGPSQLSLYPAMSRHAQTSKKIDRNKVRKWHIESTDAPVDYFNLWLYPECRQTKTTQRTT